MRLTMDRRKGTACGACNGTGVIRHKCATGCGADARYYPEHELFICEPCYNRTVLEIMILTLDGKVA